MYNYAIIKESYPDLERETVLLDNNYNPRKKYALIIKSAHRDGSESITHIKYSNHLQELQEEAKGFISWYNYPMGVSKNIQGYLSEL